ncbi:MAG TPA: FkbM family methyltransferase [Terriglobia bacterium]|nr:FkbM family methyltransferase [Terriglobia bacterium]
MDKLFQVVGALAEAAAGQANFDQLLASRLVAIEKLLREITSRTESLAARRHPAVYLGDYLAVTRALNRFYIYVDTRDLALGPPLLLEGEWEHGVTTFLLDLIKPDMTVVDVGANIGYFTLLAASLVGEKGIVYAFEPNPANFKLLQKNVIANWYVDRVRCSSCALLDQPGQKDLRAADSIPGASSLFLTEAAGTSVHLHETVTVMTKTLDEIVQDPVDVIKIDAEGSEPFILEGMKATLARSPRIKIVMEFNLQALQAAGKDSREFLKRIETLGLKVWQLTWDGHVLEGKDVNLFEYPMNTIILSRA